MLPDRVSNPGPLTYESGALPIALRGPADFILIFDSELYFSIVGCTSRKNNHGTSKAADHLTTLIRLTIDLFHIVCAHAYICHVARYFSIIGETLQRWGKRILSH